MKKIIVMIFLFFLFVAFHVFEFVKPAAYDPIASAMIYLNIGTDLIGIDNNNNGVRDDVEKKIRKRFKSENEINVFFSFVRLNQKALIQVSTEKNLSAWWIEYQEVHACKNILLNSEIFGKHDIIDISEKREWVKSKMLNTRVRRFTFNKWMYALGTRIGGDLWGSTFEEIMILDKICSFKIKDFEKVRKKILLGFLEHSGGIYGDRFAVKIFEKKHGTKYRSIYGKYLKYRKKK